MTNHKILDLMQNKMWETQPSKNNEHVLVPIDFYFCVLQARSLRRNDEIYAKMYGCVCVLQLNIFKLLIRLGEKNAGKINNYYLANIYEKAK